MLTTLEDTKAQQKDTQYEDYKRYYEANRENVISKQSDKIQCNICNSLITRHKMNRHQETEICKKTSLLLMW